MVKNKFAFLDRDGVINFDYGHVGTIDNFHLIPHSINAMQSLMKLGYKIIIVTNQAGIAKGFYTEDDFHKLMNFMINRLKKYSIKISKYYYCPHHPDAKLKKYKKKCSFRKPEPGMLLKAMNDFEIDLDHSFLAGDKITDIISGKRAGIKNLCYIGNESNLSNLSGKEKVFCHRSLNSFVENLLEK